MNTVRIFSKWLGSRPLSQIAFVGAVGFQLGLNNLSEAKVFVVHNIACPTAADASRAPLPIAIEIDQGRAQGKVTVGPLETVGDASKAGLAATESSLLAASSLIPAEAYGGVGPTNSVGLSVALEAAEGCGLSIDALEFAVDSREPWEHHYLVYAVTDGDPSSEPLSPMILQASDRQGESRQHCRFDLGPNAVDGAKRVEFRIFPVGSPPDIGLTFDEIAVNGRVIEAPLPASLLVWAAVISLATMAGYSVVFLLWSRSARALADSAERADSGKLLVLDSYHTSRATGGNWSEQTRQAILKVVMPESR